MFTKIHLKNFMSFADFEADFLAKAKEAKHLVLIYGENGAGKSNLIMAFYVLWLTTQSFHLQTRLNEMLRTINQESTPKSPEDLNFIHRFLVLDKLYEPVQNLVQDYKTIESTGPMEIVVSFLINSKPGSYLLQFSDGRITHERLEYTSNLRRTVLFDISANDNKLTNEDQSESKNKPSYNVKFKPKLFNDKTVSAKAREMLSSYFGKHSFLSILNFLAEDLSKSAFENGVDQSLRDVLHELSTMNIDVQGCNPTQRRVIRYGSEQIQNFEKGKIKKGELKKLDKTVCLLNQVLPKISSSIRSVEYDFEEEEDLIRYSLKLNKMICGKVRSIPFKKESKGTHTLLTLLPSLLMAVDGKTVIMDDFDEGIHDLCVCTLISELADQIKGQLIATTHNTSLMELDIPHSSFYIYDFDSDSNKELLSLDEFERDHPNLNIRKRYLDGLYGGIPDIAEIDFLELSDGIE